MSQGLLQSIFEYQTMICELTGMDVSNASVYDGATAAAEAAAMCRERKRRVTLISGAAHPDTINTVRTYCYGTGDELRVVPVKDGRTDMDALREMLDDGAASFYVQQPNFFGQFEDAEALGQLAHQAGAKYIMGCNPIALAIMKTPRDCGADIAVGEGQPLGLPLGCGGPYLGYMAATDKLMRKLPGRIVGETTDDQGRRAYVLSLQAREQHIRREKASSNICSNEALCALTAGLYMSTMGPDGMAQAAEQSMAKAHYLADALCATLPQPQVHASEPGTVDNQAMFALSYGLFVLSAREVERDNACIINTAAQVTDTPKRISIAVNKANYTHDMIRRTGVFNLPMLSTDAPFGLFQHYGFQSGRDVDKFADVKGMARATNGVYYLPYSTNAFVSGKVTQEIDLGTHTLFIADVTEARVLSNAPSMTYSFYFANVKPKPSALKKQTGWVCKICGYVYEGETLPADFICPLCKHGAEDFEKLPE